MQRTYSLKKNAQFKYVYRRGTSGGSHEMVMLYARANTLKVGFSVGKKLGCAVVRNRVRRRLREVYRLYEDRFLPGWDIVVVARSRCVDAAFCELTTAYLHLAEKAGLLHAAPEAVE